MNIRNRFEIKDGPTATRLICIVIFVWQHFNLLFERKQFPQSRCNPRAKKRRYGLELNKKKNRGWDVWSRVAGNAGGEEGSESKSITTTKKREKERVGEREMDR